MGAEESEAAVSDHPPRHHRHKPLKRSKSVMLGEEAAEELQELLLIVGWAATKVFLTTSSLAYGCAWLAPP